VSSCPTGDLTPDPSPIATPASGRGAPAPIPCTTNRLAIPPSPGGWGGDGRGGPGG